MLRVLLLLACADTSPVVTTETRPPTAAQSSPPASPWVGSKACAECHPEQTASWSGSHHALAQGVVDLAEIPWPSAPPLKDDAGVEKPMAVGGTIGVAPLVQGLVAHNRRMQVTPFAWDVQKSEWFTVQSDVRVPGDWGHWTGGGMTWNSQCASCHNTRVTVGYDSDQDAYDTKVGERGVGCEACHGPAAAHVQMGAKLPTISPDEDHCASCHSVRLALGDSAPVGAAVLDHFELQVPDLTDAYWPDGQVRGEDFEWSSFAGSAKYGSEATCGSCHDAHSGALIQSGDALCTTCHGDTPPHDHHNANVGCVDCHMPQTTYMARHPRRDHSFSIPNPALTVDLGIPNACNRCHEDRDATWSTAQMTAWGQGGSVRADTTRATAIAAARTGRPDAGDLLRAALTTEENPQWQASLVRSMVPYVDQTKVLQAVLAAAEDDNAQLRVAAAAALPDSHPMRIALAQDPVRAVRVRAQRGLMHQRPPNDPLMRDLRTLLDAQQDQPPQALDLASWQVAHGDARGLMGLQRAVNRWPREPTAHLQLAVALAVAGNGPAARSVLEAAVQHHPDSPSLWEALGKARAPDGDLTGARDALERAVALDGNAARSWYNLSLLRGQLGDAAGSQEAMARCEALDSGQCR